MNDERSIVIGCDDTALLPVILNRLKEIVVPVSVISVTRVTDLIGVLKSITPDLVVLCFRNNQFILNDFNAFLRKPEIPVMCLSNSFAEKKLQWPAESIVFTYPLENITIENHFGQRIQTILQLQDTSRNHREITTAANRTSLLPNTEDNRNLSRYVLELDQKIEALAKVKDRISDLYPHVNDPTRAELMSIVHAIKIAMNDTKLWDDFKVYFEATDPHFLFHLAQQHPDLTPKDLKYCCYLKMNMTNDDIRKLLGINQESVRTHKYRLKRKMALSRDEDIRAYLRSITELSIQFA